MEHAIISGGQRRTQGHASDQPDDRRHRAHARPRARSDQRDLRRALRRAKLRARTLYQTRHTFAALMLDLGESPGWVATQLGHTNAEMVYPDTTASFRTYVGGTGR